jgi:zinc protease
VPLPGSDLDGALHFALDGFDRISRDTLELGLSQAAAVIALTIRAVREEDLEARPITDQPIDSTRDPLGKAQAEQIEQLEKLATLGQTASQIVHEMNNPLTAIVAYTDFLARRLAERGEARDLERVHRIQEAADRLQRFARELTDYSRPEQGLRGPVDLHAVVDRALGFCIHGLRAGNVTVERIYRDIPPVRGLESSLTQVFVNLFTNAGHAMETHGGTMRIETRADADRVVVEVHDEGHGIEPAHLRRDLRDLLHHQAQGPRRRPRPQHRPQDRRRPRRAHLRPQPRRRRLHLLRRAPRRRHRLSARLTASPPESTVVEGGVGGTPLTIPCASISTRTMAPSCRGGALRAGVPSRLSAIGARDGKGGGAAGGCAMVLHHALASSCARAVRDRSRGAGRRWRSAAADAATHLPNGLEVVVVENHALPLVTIEIALRNGSMTEPPEFNGLSHLYEHMFFKANAVIPSQEAYMARLNALGIRFNGTTGTERVNYFFTTTAEHTRDAMVFMRDAILTPKFDAVELEKEREVVTGEMDRAEASPFFWFGRAMDERLWYRHPSRKHPLGSRKTVLATTPAMMRTIQQRYYVPNNAILVVTGDVSASDIVAQAESLYADWKKGPDPFLRYPLVQHPPLKKSEVVVVEKPVKVFFGRFAWHGPSTVAAELPATYAADAFAAYLAEPTSRFQRALVDSGLCLQASFSWFTQQNVGPITMGFAANADKVDACTKAIVAELGKMAAPGYVSEADLAVGAHVLRIDKIKERERPSDYAHVLTFWWASAGLDYYLGYADEVAKVTPADVTAFMTRYVKDKPFVFGALLAPEMTSSGLDQRHLESLVGLGGKP